MIPFVPLRLDHLVLRVTDPQRSIAFYTEVLGCTLRRQRPKLGMWHLAAGRSMIDIIDVNGSLGQAGGAAPAQGGHNVDHFCLRIEPFDEAAIIAHLHAHGIEAEPAARRFGAEGDGPSLYCRDPDGNQIELKGPPARG